MKSSNPCLNHSFRVGMILAISILIQSCSGSKEITQDYVLTNPECHDSLNQNPCEILPDDTTSSNRYAVDSVVSVTTLDSVFLSNPWPPIVIPPPYEPPIVISFDSIWLVEPIIIYDPWIGPWVDPIVTEETKSEFATADNINPYIIDQRLQSETMGYISLKGNQYFAYISNKVLFLEIDSNIPDRIEIEIRLNSINTYPFRIGELLFLQPVQIGYGCKTIQIPIHSYMQGTYTIRISNEKDSVQTAINYSHVEKIDHLHL